MSTSVDIVNQAYSHLGAKARVAAIDPPDGSPESDLAARFYSSAVYRSLEREDWTFARKRIALASVVNPSSLWRYAYAMPSDCLKARRIPAGVDLFEDDSEPFSREGQVLLTNKALAVLIYTQPITDASLFPQAFADTVSAELAAYLAGPVLKGTEGVNAAKALRQTAAAMAAAAAAEDASQDRRPENQYTPASIRARG